MAEIFAEVSISIIYRALSLGPGPSAMASIRERVTVILRDKLCDKWNTKYAPCKTISIVPRSHVQEICGKFYFNVINICRSMYLL